MDCLWDSPGKNTGVGCHCLFQGIFLTQGLNSSLLHYRQTLYCLSHQGSHCQAYIGLPQKYFWVFSNSLWKTWMKVWVNQIHTHTHTHTRTCMHECARTHTHTHIYIYTFLRDSYRNPLDRKKSSVWVEKSGAHWFRRYRSCWSGRALPWD